MTSSPAPPRPGLVGRLTSSPLVRYLAIGGTSFVVDAGLLVLLHDVLGAPVWLAGTVGYWVGVVVNFTLNRWSMGGRQGSVRAQGIRYGVLLAANYLVTMGMLQAGAALGAPAIAAKTVAVLICTAANYVLYRRWVFA